MPLYLPELYKEDTSRTTTATFRGLNRRAEIRDGELADMENLTSDHAPLLAVRGRRGIPIFPNVHAPHSVTTRALGEGGTYQAVFLDGPTLHPGREEAVDLTPYGYEDNGKERSLLPVGAYVIVIPDLIAVSTVDPEDRFRLADEYRTEEATFTVSVCDHEGTLPTHAQVTRPTESLKNGDLWHRTGSDPALFRYDEEAEDWYAVTPYLRIAATFVAEGVGTRAEPITLRSALRSGDTIRIDGIHPSVNGRRSVQGVTDYVTGDHAVSDFRIQGILSSPSVAMTASTAAPVTISRAVPVMDHVCEAGNRLWGCRYGDDGEGHFVNEIYASARGDFTRWIAGDAEDEDAPVTFSLGSDGAFTGAINHEGAPLFFKERGIHRVGGYGASGFSLYDTPCPGVARGAHRSLAVVGGVLYYKSPSAVMAYDGSLPTPVSDALGELGGYTRAVGGACGAKYYLSLYKDAGGTVTDAHLYVLDTRQGVWHREDATACESMAAAGDNLFFVERRQKGATVTHVLRTVRTVPDGETEETEGAAIPWFAETGIIGLETPDAKYVQKLTLRLQLDPGASVRVCLRYDSQGPWKPVMSTEATGLRTVTVPVTPHRCDHVRLRLEGVGGCRVYSLTKTLERGEDL